MRLFSFSVYLLTASFFFNLSLQAQFWGAKQARPIETPKGFLKERRIHLGAATCTQGPILVTVSLDEQMAYTYRNGVLIGVATASTGQERP